MSVEAAPVKLPQRERPARAAVAVGKWMDGLKAVMQNGRTENRREFFGSRVPPFQQLEHQPRNGIGRRGTILPNPDRDHAIFPGLALIHHFPGQNPMQRQNVRMADRLFASIFFHIAQPSKIIEDFPLMPRAGRGKLAPFLQGSHLCERQRVAFNSRRSMDVAGAGVFLQGGNPGKIHYGTLNALAQSRHLLDSDEQGRGDGELRNIGHWGKG